MSHHEITQFSLNSLYFLAFQNEIQLIHVSVINQFPSVVRLIQVDQLNNNICHSTASNLSESHTNESALESM